MRAGCGLNGTSGKSERYVFPDDAQGFVCFTSELIVTKQISVGFLFSINFYRVPKLRGFDTSAVYYGDRCETED